MNVFVLLLPCPGRPMPTKSYFRRLKTVDTIGKCQRLVLLLGVSQHLHKKQTCENLSSIGRQSCEIIMKEKENHCHTKLCASDA